MNGRAVATNREWVFGRYFPFVFALAMTLTVASAKWLQAHQAPRVLTGWLLFLGCGSQALTWWFAAHGRGLARRLDVHLLLALPMLACLVVHVDFHAPAGTLDMVLTAALALALVSLSVGRVLVLRHSPFVQAWLRFHIACLYSLCTLGLAHGVLIHAHGVLAAWAVRS